MSALRKRMYGLTKTYKYVIVRFKFYECTHSDF